MPKSSELPAPDGVALEHSQRVAGHIAHEIRMAGGWIDFSRYMDLALYTPGLGYYSAGATKLGPAGDFITAPECSPLFARCLARSCAPWLSASPGRHILELGAGTGALAVDMLIALERLGVAPVNYLILEVSADLRERQQAKLAQHAGARFGQVRWLDTLPVEPLDAIIIGNEVADALPVSRFERTAGGLLEQGVSAGDRGFAWESRPASAPLSHAVHGIEGSLGRVLPPGYASEVSLKLPGWMASISRVLRSGAVLLCDYGGARREYYHPERSQGTLICHYRHRAHADPFFCPGLQDITAWVDFTSVAEAADACGLAVAGYTTQAHFLMDAGIALELAAAVADTDVAHALHLSRQAQRLLLPGEMGERFKVMALTRGDAKLAGFGGRDLRHLL